MTVETKSKLFCAVFLVVYAAAMFAVPYFLVGFGR